MRIRLWNNICQETAGVEGFFFTYRLKSLLSLITFILIIIEFKGLSVKIKFVALQFKPTEMIKVPNSS